MYFVVFFPSLCFIICLPTYSSAISMLLIVLHLKTPLIGVNQRPESKSGMSFDLELSCFAAMILI